METFEGKIIPDGFLISDDIKQACRRVIITCKGGCRECLLGWYEEGAQERFERFKVSLLNKPERFEGYVVPAHIDVTQSRTVACAKSGEKCIHISCPSCVAFSAERFERYKAHKRMTGITKEIEMLRAAAKALDRPLKAGSIFRIDEAAEIDTPVYAKIDARTADRHAKQLKAAIEAHRLAGERLFISRYQNNLKKGEENMVYLNKHIADTFKKTDEALLVQKHFGAELDNGKLAGIIIRHFAKEILAQAKDLEAAEEKCCEK